MLVAFLGFDFPFQRLPLNWGPAKFTPVLRLCGARPNSQSHLFWLWPLSGFNLRYSGFYGNHLHQLRLCAYETRGGGIFFSELSLQTWTWLAICTPHLLRGFHFKKDEKKLKYKKNQLKMEGSCLLFRKQTFFVVWFFGLTPKIPLKLKVSLKVNGVNISLKLLFPPAVAGRQRYRYWMHLIVKLRRQIIIN